MFRVPDPVLSERTRILIRIRQWILLLQVLEKKFGNALQGVDVNGFN
jgi:hypothetical protein